MVALTVTKRREPLQTSPELLHVKECAQELRITPAGVRRAIHEGQLRALRLGENGRYRVRREDLDDFLRVAEPRQ